MKYIVSCVAVIALVGCGSAPRVRPHGGSSIEGVIYTAAGAPLRDATILLNERAAVSSDVNGRFTIPHVQPGAHRIRAHHRGHETLELTMTFSQPTDVLYLRVFSGDDLVDASLLALDRGRVGEAEQLVVRALTVSPDSVRAHYVAAIVYINAGQPEEARKMLAQLGPEARLPAVSLLFERIEEEESR